MFFELVVIIWLTALSITVGYVFFMLKFVLFVLEKAHDDPGTWDDYF